MWVEVQIVVANYVYRISADTAPAPNQEQLNHSSDSP